MKYIAKLCILTIFLSIGVGYYDIQNTEAYTYNQIMSSRLAYLMYRYGYDCEVTDYSKPSVFGKVDVWTCTKTTSTTSAPTYSAIKHDYRTLEGRSQSTTTTTTDVEVTTIDVSDGEPNEGASDGDTPLIYFHNPPEGNISVSLDSQLDKYYPQPDFNQENGWLAQAKDKKISLNGEQENYLFYELEISRVALNREGKNFTSKEELVDYLENSDFLTKLGFSEIEKKNSLKYILPKIAEREDKKFYYLSILSDDAIAEISTLTVQPTPEQVVRQYFAVYPTDVPVKTTGNFQFPEKNTIDESDFVVKETGEFLIKKSTYVFFE